MTLEAPMRPKLILPALLILLAGLSSAEAPKASKPASKPPRDVCAEPRPTLAELLPLLRQREELALSFSERGLNLRNGELMRVVPGISGAGISAREEHAQQALTAYCAQRAQRKADETAREAALAEDAREAALKRQKLAEERAAKAASGDVGTTLAPEAEKGTVAAKTQAPVKADKPDCEALCLDWSGQQCTNVLRAASLHVNAQARPSEDRIKACSALTIAMKRCPRCLF